MITKWKLGNFKSFRDETEIEMGPLTIFAGPNSSGKSAILQSILMIKQTLESRLPSRALVLNGNLIKLGKFGDIINSTGMDICISIGCEFDLKASTRNIARSGFEVKFTTDTTATKYHEQNKPIVQSCRLAAGEEFIEVSRSVKDLNELAEQHKIFLIPEELAYLQYQVINNMIRVPSKLTYIPYATILESLDAAGCKMEKFFPVEILERESLLSFIEIFLEGNISINFLALPEVRYKLDFEVPDRFFELYEESLTEDERDVLMPESIKPYILSLRNVLIFWGVILENLDRINSPEHKKLNKDWDDGIADFPVTKAEGNRMDIEAIGEDFNEDVLPDDLKWLLDIDNYFKQNPDKCPWNSFVRMVEILSATYGFRSKSDPSAEPAGMIAFKEYKEYFKNVIGDYYVPKRSEPLLITINEITEYFTSYIHYLGPLREPPQALYPLDTQLEEKNVGIKGEYTATVLEYYKDDTIEYIPSNVFANGDELGGVLQRIDDVIKSVTLKEAIIDWLQYLDVAKDVVTEDKANLGIELQVGINDNTDLHSLMHVGVGVSQVLPILVMCLLGRTDSIFILEQPELHLHPKVQTRLADFFLSMSLLDKQCIIETHSEYIINRLRYRIAASTDEEICERVKIIFVEKKHGASTCREVEINRYGAILDWPEGFFDQSADEADMILRAAMQKRAAEGKGGKNDFSDN